MIKDKETLKHLFQQEFSKMVAVISRRYGLQHIETAEDIVSETFLKAAETWGIKGMPENPPAWLYAVARQKMLYHFRRNKILDEKIIPELKTAQDADNENGEINFSADNIKDSVLQMMFAVCSPAIASEAQIGLALRILCGFGIDEIAEAFFTNKETVNKRLLRAKERLRTENVKMELPPENEISCRLDNVLRIIYLLFNEGYYSRTQNKILRKELCLEALRLALVLAEYEKTNLPKTNALIALMCFHSSRFNARETGDESMILYEQQNEDLWDKDLIKKGMHYLDLSAQGNEISSYHIEAKIAFWHCVKDDSKAKWEDILNLYDQLILVNFSPGAALNRIYALYKVKGPEAALAEAAELNFQNNHFYFLLLGELYKNIDKDTAKLNFEKAFALAKTKAEKEDIRKKMEDID